MGSGPGSEIRPACLGDAAELVRLTRELGYAVDEPEMADRLLSALDRPLS